MAKIEWVVELERAAGETCDRRGRSRVATGEDAVVTDRAR